MSRVLDKAFGDQVAAQSALSSETNAYPRPDLNALHQYLKAPSAAVLPQEDMDEIKIDTSDFILIQNLATGVRNSFGSLPAEIARFKIHDIGSDPVLVFIRGHASAQWLEAVAAKFRLSPELYQRHLHWRAFASGDRDLHTLPPLPSCNASIFQLVISTICHRSDVPFSIEPEDLQEARRQGEERMKQYFRNMRNKAHVGDSLVRKCLLFGKQDFVIQQTITVEVLPAGESSWQAVAWLDSGRDLSQSVPGPWMPHEGTPSWQTYFFPVIVQRPVGESLALTSTRDSAHLAAATVTSAPPSPSLRGIGHKPLAEWKAAQNVCTLPLQYGAQLNKSLTRQDTLYVLSDIFQFAASSELQLLNFLRRRIEHELSFAGQDEVGRRNAVALVNLKYIMAHLQSHARRLTETVSLLENRDWTAWPAVPSPSAVDKVAHRLVVDFRYLLERANTLVQACESGMDTLANSSVLEETRRSTDNAMRLQRLTVIATIFIPLSFVCSVWGMNFKELGSGDQPLWMYAATAMPIILFSLLLYHYDSLLQQCRRAYASLGENT